MSSCLHIENLLCFNFHFNIMLLSIDHRLLDMTLQPPNILIRYDMDKGKDA